MKIIHDTAIFDIEKGTCWRNTPVFIGYGAGYPEEVVLCNFTRLREEPVPCRLECMLHANMYRKYYQRRVRQLRQFSVFFIQEGEMYFRSNGRIVLAEQGDCVLLKPHFRNDFLYLPGGRCSYFEIILTGTRLDDMIRLYNLETVWTLHFSDVRPFQEIFNRMKKLRKAVRHPVSHLLAGVAAETLQMVATAAGQQTVSSELAAIRNRLEQGMNEKVGMPEIARQFGLTLAELNGRFRAVFGMTPFSYRKKFRLRYGAGLLRRGSPVKEAAARTGYDSPKSFATEFLLLYGVSPRQYRNENSETGSAAPAAAEAIAGIPH